MSIEKFIVYPKTGAWGIAKEGSEEELLEELKQQPLPEKKYLGAHSIILNTTDQCNMGCIYCSASDNRSKQEMDIKIAKKTLDEAIKLETIPRIVFHGSEPLLNMPLIRATVMHGESLPKRVLFYIQSNLTTLTTEKLKFIREHNIGVSTSIDGFRAQHNATRPFRNGSPSYNLVTKNMGKVMQGQKGMCTVTVVTGYNVSSLSDIALDLESRGVTHIQFLPSVKCSKSDTDFRPTNEELTKSYVHLFEQTFRRMERGEQKAVIRNIPQFLASMFIRTGVDSCRICSSADYHPLLAVDINGDIFPCDYFFRKPDHVIGNIMKDSLVDVLNSPRNSRNGPIEDTACGKCDIRRICGGGCMADRIFSGDKPYYCQTYRAMYEFLGSKMPELREKGLIKRAMENL